MHQNTAAVVVREEQSQVRETKYVVCKISQCRLLFVEGDALFFVIFFTYSMTEMHTFVAAPHCQYLFTRGNNEQRAVAQLNDNCQHTIYAP